MPRNTMAGNANLLVLPDIDAANISYNLLKTEAGGNIAVGPILLGFSPAGTHLDCQRHRAPDRQHDRAAGGGSQCRTFGSEGPG